MDPIAYFNDISASALGLRGVQTSEVSLLVMLPEIIASIDPLSQGPPLSVERRQSLALNLQGLLQVMTARRLDVTLEEWMLEAHGEKKVKEIVNFKRTNASPDGLHSVFVLPVYTGPDDRPCTVVQHQLRPHAGIGAHLEIPAGKFDAGDKSTEATAARELEEETGLIWDHTHHPPIARGGHHSRDGGMSNARGEVLVVPVDPLDKGSRELSADEQAQGLGQIHDFPLELIPEYVDYCISQGLAVTGTFSNIALGMKVQRYIAAGGGAESSN